MASKGVNKYSQERSHFYRGEGTREQRVWGPAEIGDPSVNEGQASGAKEADRG